MTNLTVTLPDPVLLPDGARLTTLTLRPATAGSLALARAAITRDKRFGPLLVDDGLTMLLFSLPFLVVAFDVPTLPNNWPMLLSENSVVVFADAFSALREGYGSLEEFRAEKRAKADAARAEQAKADGEEEGDSFPAALPSPQPASVPPAAPVITSPISPEPTPAP